MPSVSGVALVSADSHLSLGGVDFWYDNAPPHLKDRVPRIRYDAERGHWDTLIDGKSFYPAGAEKLARTMEARRGGWDMEARIADLDGESVAKEIAFPQNLMRLVHYKDLEVREYVFREYNRYLASLQQRAPGRFYGVGVLANYWAPERAAEVLREAKALGLKTLMLPCNPGLYPDGEQIYYQSRKMRPLWEAVEEAGLPICFHISEGLIHGGGGGLPITVLNAVSGVEFPQVWGQFVFGRIFDNHPSLRIAFVEAGIHWVPGLLLNAEIVLESFKPILDYVPKREPREYWAENCAATFMHDPSGLRQLDVIGVDNVMWSVDYPHSEGTFGYTGRTIDYILEAVSPEDARKILSENAIRFFKLT
jgi:predicted TIM-barrel fold metal-dependent hydrolase